VALDKADAGITMSSWSEISRMAGGAVVVSNNLKLLVNLCKLPIEYC